MIYTLIGTGDLTLVFPLVKKKNKGTEQKVFSSQSYLQWHTVPHPDRSSHTGRTAHGMTALYVCP